MWNRIKLIIVIGLLLLLSSCKFDFTGNFDLADLHQVAQNPDVQYTANGLLEIDFLSGSQCSKSEDKVEDLLSNLFVELIQRGCVEVDNQDLMRLEVRFPIVYGVDAWQQTMADVMVGLLIVPHNEVEYAAYLMNNTRKFEKLMKDLSLKFFQDIDIEESTIRLVLANSNYDQIIEVSGVFVNQKPRDLSETITLAPLSQHTIQLSDVGVSSWASNGFAKVLYFDRLRN